MLDQLEVHGGFRCKGKTTILQVQVHGPGGKHSPQVETITHRESVLASHHGATASLLDQSEVHGGFRCKGKTILQVQVHGPGGKQANSLSRDKHAP